MPKKRVMIEVKYGRRLARVAEAAAMTAEPAFEPGVVPKLGTLSYDKCFPPVGLPGLCARERSDDPYDTSALVGIDDDPEAATFIVRGEVEEAALKEFERETKRNAAVVGVFTDVAIQPTIVCPGHAPVGCHATVERLLCAKKMHDKGMDGRGVLVAIVDTGVNLPYLNSHGKHPNFDAGRSWAWTSGLTPGSMPVDHGTMCAFDVCIAAPRCTLLDIALLHSIGGGSGSPMEGLLSDAVRAYRHLLNVIRAARRPGENTSLVVNNSWAMFHPSWDYPVGHPGNYSDNPSHPFNRIVATLERAGADILFAAGNCGADCPDDRCLGVTANTIYGANSHPAVTSVAGVDVNKDRVGYSAIGPGRLESMKPDISGYTHFSGSGVYSADGGTSAACPVVSGVVAAVRSKRPYDPAGAHTHPAAIRNLLISTAEDRGAAGYDYKYGWGVVNGCALVDKLFPPSKIDIICRRYPWLCRWLRWREGLWRSFPAAAPEAIAREAVPLGLEPPELPEWARCEKGDLLAAFSEAGNGEGEEPSSAEELAFFFGYLASQADAKWLTKPGQSGPEQSCEHSGGRAE